MPSFPTEHYTYYILMMTHDPSISPTHRHSKQLSSVDLLEINKKKSHRWISMIFVLICVLFTIGIFLVFGWSHYLNYYAQRHTDKFYAYNLHWIMDFLACIFFAIDLFHVFTISISV